ncbi:MAG: RluA family pseudouridine synthase [Dongiaceae bacterium]
MTAVQTLTVAAGEAELRLDRWFKRHFPAVAHGRLEKLLRTGQVRVDGKRVKASHRLSAGEAVRVPPLDEGAAARPSPTPKPTRAGAAAERMAEMLLRAVIHRDDWVIAIDKPAGLAVQGGSGTDLHLDGLLDVLRFDAPERPRLVHRLDRDTSGVLLLARNARAATLLGETFRHKTVKKLYWAAVIGLPRPAAGVIDLALSKLPGRGGERIRPDEEDGRRAVTRYRVREHAGDRAAWLALMPETGRTHQLRVHCVAMGTPILGDGKYGGAGAFLPGRGIERRLHLHARAIELPHPEGKLLRLAAPLPDHMKATWRFLGFNITAGAAKPADFDI